MSQLEGSPASGLLDEVLAYGLSQACQRPRGVGSPVHACDSLDVISVSAQRVEETASALSDSRLDKGFVLSLSSDGLDALATEVAAILAEREPQRPEYLTTAGAASYLGWAKKRIDNLCLQGRIPFHKEGGRRIFIRQEIDAWVAQLDGTSVERALDVAF